MPFAKLDVVNLALHLLGQRRLATLTEDNDKQALVDDTYDLFRDAVLEDFPWPFATTRTQLAASATAPAWRYTYAYPLPSDYLKVWEIDNPDFYFWQIEEVAGSDHIVTSLGPTIDILYTRRVTAHGRYPAMFIQALSARLAAEWAEKLAPGESIRADMRKLYEMKVQEARTSKSQEGTDPEAEVYGWIEARQQARFPRVKADPTPY